MSQMVGGGFESSVERFKEESLVLTDKLCLFSADIDQDEKVAILEAWLWAELSIKELGIPHGQLWFGKYQETLRALGGEKDPPSFLEEIHGGDKMSASDASLLALGRVGGDSARKMAETAIAKLRNDAPALSLFERRVVKGDAVAFQVMSCVADPGGWVNIALYYNFIRYKNKRRQFLFFADDETVVTSLEYGLSVKFNADAYRLAYQKTVRRFLSNQTEELFRITL